jgi:hypothetical protein
VHADVAREVVADLENANIEHHLRPIAGQLAQQLRTGLQRRPWPAHFDDSPLSGIDLLKVADVAQRGD